MTTDFTQGSITKKLMLFALPLLVGSLVQQLYNTVDLIFTGQLIGTDASSAIGISTMLITCLVNFFSGIAVGSGIVISQAAGRHDKKSLKCILQNALFLSLIGGLLLVVLGLALTGTYLRLMKTPADLMPLAGLYLRIYACSFISVFAYNVCSGAVRALGDSRTPLLAQIFGGLTNVVMDGFFIAVLKTGVAGVAWATFFSQTAAALIVVVRIIKEIRSLSDEKNVSDKFRPDMQIIWQIIRIGVPAGAQALLITLSNVMAQYQINGLGSQAIAAFTAYYKVELIIYYPIMALGQAMMTFAGQNMGAGEVERIRKGTRSCLLIGIGLSAVLSVLSLAGGRILFSVFSKDAEVIAYGLQIIAVAFPFYFVYNFLQIFGDSIRGCGEVKMPMLIVMINLCLVRTGLLFLLVPRFRSVRAVAVCYPITWLLTGLGMGAYYFYFHRSGMKAKSAGGL